MKEKIGVLLCGIRYAEGSGHLKGCHNDVINIYNFLKNKYEGSKYDLDFIILADFEGKLCGDIDCIWPSKLNILNSLETLRNKGYKKYFIHYSGHGTSQFDWGGEEDDLKDEVICPYDYASSGSIADDTLNSHFLQHLGSDCYVRILMDCCRSGTIWDLKYRYGNGVIDKINAPEISCNVIVLSGCKDNQYSYDVYTAGESQGAFTHCFLKTMNNNSNAVVTESVKLINNCLVAGGWGGQTSRLTSSFLLTDKDIFLHFEKIEGGQAIDQGNITTVEEEDDVDWWILDMCSVM